MSELIQRHMAPVRAMVYPMVLNHADADDLVQDIFIRVNRGIHRFRKKAQFSTWLYRIAMNTTRSFLRRKYRAPEQAELEKHPAASETSPCPGDNLVHAELDRDIQQALDALPEKLRAAVVLCILQEMEPAEAAQIQQCTRATMYWRIHEARKILKNHLGHHLTP